VLTTPTEVTSIRLMINKIVGSNRSRTRWSASAADATAPVAERDSRAAVLGKVLIVDDCALYREALASALRSNGIPRVRTTWDLPSLIGALESAAPQMILLNMSADKVHTFLRAARKLRPEVPVVAVATPEDDPNMIFACAEAGVATYHMKADSLADLVVLIHLVAEGQTWCPPQIAATLLRRVPTVAGSRRSATKDSGLTAREIQVLHMLELGWSNQDIARELSIAVHTVKNHVHNLLTKLGVNTRAEAAAAFHRLRADHGDRRGPVSRSSQSWLR